VQQIKDGYANFGNNDFNAMTIMNSYITDNPGNVHLKVEDIQAIYNEVKSAKQMLVSDMELKLKVNTLSLQLSMMWILMN